MVTWDSESRMGPWKMKQLLAKLSVRGNKGFSGEGCKCSCSHQCSGYVCVNKLQRESSDVVVRGPGHCPFLTIGSCEALGKSWRIPCASCGKHDSSPFTASCGTLSIKWNERHESDLETGASYANIRVSYSFSVPQFRCPRLSENRKMLAQDNFHNLEGGGSCCLCTLRC